MKPGREGMASGSRPGPARGPHGPDPASQDAKAQVASERHLLGAGPHWPHDAAAAFEDCRVAVPRPTHLSQSTPEPDLSPWQEPWLGAQSLAGKVGELWPPSRRECGWGEETLAFPADPAMPPMSLSTKQV
ncbi:hypothetical protein P7K49_017291 [Saguinus oedipus]|uniref:Uncharacterized protein n=1 Tax=Saguinus oedipus TaxID=9490 RepID=A0ABQ9V2T4_SAGOE|nr:hypothetical protein P7K49_017291 [Saguinus oedipus]